MRSFEISPQGRRVSTRASGRNALAAALAAFALFAAGAADAGLTAPTITGAELQVSVGTTLPPIVIPQSGSVTPGVSRNSASVLTGISIPTPPPIVATAGQVIPVTDPGAAPIKGIQATAANGAGSFSGTPNAVFGGQMPLVGVNKVCLFLSCSIATANIEVPISVVGLGGATAVTGAVNLTVIGAPWTTMTAAVGTITIMGGVNLTPEGGQGSQQIIPGNGTQMTVDNVSLVTPVFVSTNIGASAVVPVFGVFNFVITTTRDTPEPAAIAALGASIAALVTVGVSRRRKR